MDERDFWSALEFRVSREFSGMPERRYRYFWCDGFTPEHRALDSHRPRITGRAWICNGPVQDLWEFTLLLPAGCSSAGQVDWEALLPAAECTAWMDWDEAERRIEIDPAAALPEATTPSRARSARS